MKKRKKEAKQKEMAISVSNVYLHVVEDVINSVRSEFHSEGVDDNILNDLQSRWEHKLVQSGVVQEASSHEYPGAKPLSEPVAGPPVHDLNVPYSATEEPYVAPPSDAMFGRVNPSTGSREPVMFQYLPAGPSEESARQSSGYHLPLTMGNVTPSSYMVNPSTGSREPVMFQYIPAGPSEEFVRQSSGYHLPLTMGNGMPNSYMQQPASWMNQNRRGVELNMNETYEERDEGDNGLAQLPVTVLGVPPITKDFLTISTGKRKHDEISSGYYFPQRDGATDGATDDATDGATVDELCTSTGDAPPAS